MNETPQTHTPEPIKVRDIFKRARNQMAFCNALEDAGFTLTGATGNTETWQRDDGSQPVVFTWGVPDPALALTKAREAMEKYGRCLKTCSSYVGIAMCDCGYADALALLPENKPTTL